MKIRMLCDYGKLKYWHKYVVTETGADWVRIGNLHVPCVYVEWEVG